GATSMHRVVEGYGFTFAIGVSPQLDFLRSLPVHGESVRARPQVADPRVHERERNTLILATGGGGKDGPDSAHLPIVGGRINRDIGGLGKSGKAGETKEG